MQFVFFFFFIKSTPSPLTNSSDLICPVWKRSVLLSSHDSESQMARNELGNPSVQTVAQPFVHPADRSTLRPVTILNLSVVLQ